MPTFLKKWVMLREGSQLWNSFQAGYWWSEKSLLKYSSPQVLLTKSCAHQETMQLSWCEIDDLAVLNRKSLPTCSFSVAGTLSHPPSVFSFRPCEGLKEALKFKVLHGGSESKWERERKKKLDGPKRRLCVLLFGSAREGFSWKTARDWLKSGGSFLEGWGEMWITASERVKPTKVCWGPSLLHRHGPFPGSAALAPQRGDFFIYLFNFMPCRPQNGPIPSSKLPCLPFVVASPNPLPPKCLMETLFLACCCFLLDEEGWRVWAWWPENLHRKVLNLWDLPFCVRVFLVGVGTGEKWKGALRAGLKNLWRLLNLGTWYTALERCQNRII